MIDGQERGRLDGPPEDSQPGALPERPAAPAENRNSGFEFNNPTIVSLLYLASFLVGFTSIIGIVLAYVWNGEAREEWELSHYTYLIRTFWIGLIGGLIGFITLIVLIGFVILPAVAVLVIIRCVLSLVNAQKRAPMPNPETLLA